MRLLYFSWRWLGAPLLFVLTVGGAWGQNIQQGQDLYNLWCASCHGGATDSEASKATTVQTLNTALASVNVMQSLGPLLSPTDRQNIVAYIASAVSGGSTPQPQTISFPSISNLTIGGGPVTLGASTTSNLGIVYSVVSGPCSVVSNIITGNSLGKCVIAANQPGNSSFLAAPQVTQTVLSCVRDYSDMWWVGQSENGWGLSIKQKCTQQADGSVTAYQFAALYVYDSAGQPRWYVLPGGTWSNNFTVFSGALYQPTGSPLNNFNTNQVAVGASVGTLTFTYTGSGTATMNYTINGVSGSKSIVRQPFGSGTPPLDVGDLWWGGPSENGWGFNLAQQGSVLFGVWYTYAPDGKAYWVVMPGGSWNGSSYVGDLYTTTGSPWLGATYNPNALTVTKVGTATFNFSNANNVTMNYVFTTGAFAGTNQTKTVVRQPF